jgi:hypothetical protein
MVTARTTIATRTTLGVSDSDGLNEIGTGEVAPDLVAISSRMMMKAANANASVVMTMAIMKAVPHQDSFWVPSCSRRLGAGGAMAPEPQW